MLLYRLFTERVNPKIITSLAAKYLNDCTILEGKGLFNNEEEQTTIIEYSTGTNEDELIRSLANEICEANNQEAVLIQKHNIDQYLITQ